jgi:tetratricopeptide (TPR) repeat protein
MLPVMVTLYEFIFFQGEIRKRVLYLVPILLTILIIPLTLINIDKPLGDLIGDISDETKGATTLSREAYLLTSFRVVVTYILFLPINQNLDYDYPAYYSFFNIEVIISFLFLLLIFGTGIFLLYRYRHTESHMRLISFGIFWFFINLILESSIIPLSNVIFEHRMYLPSIGALIAIITSIFWGMEKLKDRWNNIKRFVIVLLILIVVALTGTTYTRNKVWGDEITLWQDVVKKSPKKEQSHNNLGRAYELQRNFAEAIEHFRIAFKINPKYSQAYYNLGNLYRSQGLLNEAIEHYKIAVQLNFNFPEAHNNLGGIYKSLGFIDKAVEQYLIALKINPDFKNAHMNIGFAYIKKDNIEKAIYHLENAIKLEPDDSKAHLNLGIAYKSKGLMEQANEHFRIACVYDFIQ